MVHRFAKTFQIQKGARSQYELTYLDNLSMKKKCQNWELFYNISVILIENTDEIKTFVKIFYFSDVSLKSKASLLELMVWRRTFYIHGTFQFNKRVFRLLKCSTH